MKDSRVRRAIRQPGLNRRAFLRGSAGIAIGLPFLESAPDRSAWAGSLEPRFAFFIGVCNGVVQDRFWPSTPGERVTELSTDPNAAGALAGFEDWISFCQGFSHPMGPTGDTHAQGYSQTFTGAPYSGGGNMATSTAPSIDTILAPYLNPDGAEPLALYSGMKAGYIDERMSFIAAGQVREAEGNPYAVYQALMQLAASPADAAMVDAALNDRLKRRATALDFVRDDLATLLGRTDLSQRDRARLELHLDGLRDLESGMAEMPAQAGMCSEDVLDVAAIEESDGIYRRNGQVEHIAELQTQLAVFAFSCNLNHVGTLQHGDGQDSSLYDVPSNERGWTFHHISHRVQSDGAAGNDRVAEDAHAEIDRVRLETFARGLTKFEQHGLLDKTVILWANSTSDGPSGSFANLPIILAGNAGGTLQTGLHLSRDNGFGGGRHMADLLTTVAHAVGVEQPIGEADGLVEELLV